jgi:RHS repeat-associated protein
MPRNLRDAHQTKRYDVITLSLDRDEKPIARACTWYNNLHLPKRETRYLLNGQGGFIEASETRLTYNADREKRARITSYNIPVRTEAFCNTSSNGEPTWLALNYTEAKYNDYGNPVESTTWVNVKDTGYTKQGSTKTEYLTTQAEVQFPAKVWNRDEVSGMLEYKEHKPSPDGKSVESAVTWYQDSLEPRKQLQPWKETICKYDSFGRAVSNTVAWSSGANVPDGAVRSFTTRTEYSKFDKGLLSRTEIDALGKPTVLQQDMRLSTSPIIRKTLPLGQTETFEFDPIGRILKHVNAQGQFTTTAHIPGPAGTSTIVTSPLGYRTKTSFDVLGREFEVSDNGDPTVTLNDQASRNLGHKRYDTRGSVEDSTNRLGLTTRASYDALNRPLTSTDVHGNVVSYKYDNGGLKVTQAINDDTRKITDLDGLFRPVLEVDYPDSSDQSTDFCIVSEYIYTSDGKVSHKTVSQQSKSSTANESRTRLIDEETKYGPGQIVQSEISRGYTEDGCETVARRYIHDLFGNKTTYTKQTSYADGRAFTHQGPTKFFNENNQLVTYRNQEGKEEHHSFDDNGWLKKKVRFDGSGVSYSCNDLGQVSKVVYPSSTTENTWDADGRLIQTREGANAINYSISLDDTSTGLKYSDGRAQSTVLDKFSRPVKEINVFGVVKETEYNSVGSVTRRSCQSETVTYAYGTTNHARGQHVGSKFSGKRNYQTDHAYDGFNRLRQTIVRDSDSSVVLETTYQVDAKEKIRSVTSKSAVFSEHNFKRDFSYDGIGQLLQETRTSPNPSTTKYSYDGNSNVSSIDIEGHTIHMAYNKIDQRTDEGFKYDTNGRLLQDNEGRRFSFDERDRLLSVSEPSHSDTKYIYRPDDRLAQRSQGDTDSATFYYDTTKINAIHTTSKDGHHQDAKTSLFSDSDSILAGFTDGEYLGHALKQMGSTAVVVGPDSHVSSLYSAYGTQNSSPVESLLSSFGFSQAFTDQVHGLIYLSSRFYNPKQMSFLSMDTYETENRYTYCEGDPINRIDPTGHSWVDWLATGVGIGVAIGVGAAVTALTAGTSAPLMAAILGGILGGTLGNVSSLAVTQLVGGRDVTAGEYLAAGIMGGIVGGLSAGVGYTMTQAAGASVLKAMSGGAFTGGLTAGVSESLNMLNKGEEFSFSRLALSVASGAAKGAISGYWARRTFLRNQMYESAAPGRTWSRTATIGANDGPRSESGMDAIEIIQKVTASNGVVYEILRLY